MKGLDNIFVKFSPSENNHVYSIWCFEESFIKCGKCLNLYSKALIEKSSNILWRGRVILKWVPEITTCRVVALDIRTRFPSLYLDVVIAPLFHQYQKREIRMFVFVRLCIFACV